MADIILEIKEINKEVLRMLRAGNDLSQTELGKEIGVTQQRVSLLENGLPPNPNELKKIAKVFKIESLINGDEK